MKQAKLRLLVADDEADALGAAKLIFVPEYEVLTAANGEEALQVARDGKPDVILLDLIMPRLDGFQVLEQLRANPATAEIPVLVLSAQRNEEDKVRVLELGADYLEKPCSAPELLARLERAARLLRSQAALRDLARTDALTGLGNLRAFRARLEAESKRASRYRTHLTCVMADLDGLKPINDTLGHAAGDQAIAAFAAVLREELRETDFGARCGGDEFAVLLPHTDGEAGRVYAERVRARLELAEVTAGGRRMPVVASFGVACQSPEGIEGAEALLLAADRALYAAKHAGRGRVAVATQANQES